MLMGVRFLLWDFVILAGSSFNMLSVNWPATVLAKPSLLETV